MADFTVPIGTICTSRVSPSTAATGRNTLKDESTARCYALLPGSQLCLQMTQQRRRAHESGGRIAGSDQHTVTTVTMATETMHDHRRIRRWLEGGGMPPGECKQAHGVFWGVVIRGVFWRVVACGRGSAGKPTACFGVVIRGVFWRVAACGRGSAGKPTACFGAWSAARKRARTGPRRKSIAQRVPGTD